ncbi:hypothetical protein ACFY30_04165 [Streptomyces sp. NPDC000345]|uniref:hypothetical protein n=1 Tax=Streptomyces sp. NPDC000345 TaxID=3364537 RepID=UPI0036AD1CBD
MGGGEPFTARDGLRIAAAVLFGAVVLAVVVLTLGTLKRLVRAAAPALTDLPGGGWTAGAVLGLLSVAGWAGGVWCAAPERSRGRRAYAVAGAVCRALSFGPALLVLGALPGRTCSSGSAVCAYIPGTGGVFVMYAVTVGVAVRLRYRGRRTRTKARRAERQARLRRLRKKGRGKSRAARTR